MEEQDEAVDWMRIVRAPDARAVMCRLVRTIRIMVCCVLCKYVCMCVCVYVYHTNVMYVCIYIYICICI